MAPANLLTQWSRLLVESLADAGLRHVVISPGSRSTPLVAAVLDCSQLSWRCIIDERSAGFFALGQAKLLGEPVALVCTSGSAVAHYLPALIEADESRVPLVVVSADRPAELQQIRSPQTIDQTGLFGAKVRVFVDLGAPTAGEQALRGLRRKALQAAARARAPLPGPVHLNFPADKPLEPTCTSNDETTALEQRVSALLAAAAPVHHAATSAIAASLTEAIGAALAGARRPLIVVGPNPLADHAAAIAIGQLARRSGWPLWCESTSQLRFGEAATGALDFDAFDWVLRADPEHAAPDRVLQFGEPPTSGAFAQWLQSARDVELVVVHPSAWADPSQRARLVVNAPVAELARSLETHLVPVSAAWRERVSAANQAAWQCVREALQAADAPTEAGFDEACAFDVVGRQLHDGDLLSLGNSLPVRIADAVLARRATNVRCLSQRGANGIDGSISSAAGAACLHDGFTLAVIGDVSALHDVGGLLAAAAVERPLTLLVLNNRGGRIFEQLPLDAWAAQRDGQLMTDGAATPKKPQEQGPAGAGARRLREVRTTDAWITPHDHALWRFADAAGLRAFRVQSAVELEAALGLARQHGRPCLIEAEVAPSGARAFFDGVTARLRARLAALDLQPASER